MYYIGEDLKVLMLNDHYLYTKI